MCSDSGVVVDNVSYALNDRARILERINEHYGTSFTGWSDNEISLRLGDTVPNWDAYEKIELPEILVAIHMSNEMSPMVFGKLKGDTVSLASQNASEAYIATGQGQIVSGSVDITNPTYINTITSKVQSQYPDVTSIGSFLETYNVGDFVSNWEDYIIIT